MEEVVQSTWEMKFRISERPVFQDYDLKTEEFLYKQKRRNEHIIKNTYR